MNFSRGRGQGSTDAGKKGERAGWKSTFVPSTEKCPRRSPVCSIESAVAGGRENFTPGEVGVRDHKKEHLQMLEFSQAVPKEEGKNVDSAEEAAPTFYAAKKSGGEGRMCRKIEWKWERRN